MKYYIIGGAALALIAIAAVVIISISHSRNSILDDTGTVNSYTQISQTEAKEMMAKDDGHVIVDVRRQDEFDSGHIPGAICIPNESIGKERPERLPDLDQIILVYCRSGRRSKEASQKLFEMGYTRVYEFGGIIEWTGETVTENADQVSDSEYRS